MYCVCIFMFVFCSVEMQFIATYFGGGIIITIFLYTYIHVLSRAYPGFGRGGQELFSVKFGNLHVSKRHAAHGFAMRFAMRVRGHAPPPEKFF